jgi:GTP diphosphokinase / guanosine-3',5'-bis(diphosphate) 3'-diphosphatase
MKKSVEQIIEKILQYNPQADTELIRKAFEQAGTAHEGQVRQSGEPFLKHPLAVAEILTQLKMDVPSIVAGLLHDTLEDTKFTREQIEKEFGKEVAKLVDGVTKIGKIKFRSYEEKQAENFRKMILSMAEDIRVIILKLADRLHNMRTLGSLSEYKQRRIAQETQDVYAPLAHRLGIGWMKSQLEDLCFQHLTPEVYFDLVTKMAQKREEREGYIREVVEIIRKSLKEYGFKGEVMGRPKHLYGIYQKMRRRGIPLEEVYDLLALRIITDTKMSCYGILGMIHSLWRPVPGRFKDYIGVPKSNLYQSLHTTVMGPRAEHIEFQIRTEEMHRIAEQGIAAHWQYKEGGKIDERDNRLFAWLRQLLEWQQELPDSRQFLDSIKTDLFSDVVYIFTPRGDVKELLKGSTPIDFAYSVHTEIGNHCSGAKVNGKIVPLRYHLQSGDSVEILTAQNQSPNKDWLKIVRSPRAKAKIKHFIRLEEQKRSHDIGKKIIERELRKLDLSPNETFKSNKFLDLMKELGMSNEDELMVAIGYGRIPISQILKGFLPESPLEEKVKKKVISKAATQDVGVRIKGVNDILIHLSKCCNPVPGDRIIGFITRGRGLSIHTVDCPNIDELDYDKDRLVEVDWDSKQTVPHPIQISVVTVDRPGMLASVSASISSAETNISHAEIKTTDDRKAILNFVVEILNTAHLEKVLKSIEQVQGVLHAKRIRRG